MSAGDNRPNSGGRHGGGNRPTSGRPKSSGPRSGRPGDDRRGGQRSNGPRDAGARGSGPRDGGARVRPQPGEPILPDDVEPGDLDPAVRRDLKTLDKGTAELVARHLVMVGRLADEDPVLALEHARAARHRASRIGVVRETVGVAAYRVGEWQEALGELRAAKRILGGTALLPLIADCERGLGRPDRALEIARGDEARRLPADERLEMLLVEAGARLDMGEADRAVVTLQSADLSLGQTGPEPTRLFYAYAEALLAAGRRDESLTWFMNAAAADVDDLTDAELRMVELANGDSESDADAEIPPTVPEISPTVPEIPPTVPTNAPSVPTNAPTVPTNAPTVPETSPSVPTNAPSVPEIPASVPEIPASVPSNAPSVPERALASGYDAVLLDLDGTVFAGQSPIPGAREAIAELPAEQTRYVTNNASRRPAEVADHLRELGFDATPDQVVTSAQAGARLVAQQIPAGSTVLVVGTDGLAAEVTEVGLVPTRSAADSPRAVVQGHSPDTDWAALSEAALAVAAGALWVATNVDATLPNERGMLIGNGSMVAAVANATGAAPQIAGKPAAPLLRDAMASAGAQNPLIVGDRLDTDIEGANTVGVDSLMVLTGVNSLRDVLVAPANRRPTHIGADLAALARPASSSEIGASQQWTVTGSASNFTLVATTVDADPAGAVPALVAAAWRRRLAENDLGSLVVTSENPVVSGLLRELGVG